MVNGKDSRKGYCPHFGENMDLENCFFCFRKLEKERKKTNEKAY
jgi:hypothetical protein